jgi:GNAT superfamily N-acetyltransferase
MQGWVTNLLIDPKYRGFGYSKILMAATEGIARS